MIRSCLFLGNCYGFALKWPDVHLDRSFRLFVICVLTVQYLNGAVDHH